MQLHLTEEFLAQFDDAQPAVQKAVLKQLKLLEANVRHPSLHAKKFDEAEDLWQVRINKSWRFYFIIQKDVYRIIEMKFIQNSNRATGGSKYLLPKLKTWLISPRFNIILGTQCIKSCCRCSHLVQYYLASKPTVLFE